MEYFFSKKDSNGYIHSIDNLILTYYIEDIGLKGVERFLTAIQNLKNDYSDLDYWEKLNINPCRKYSYFQHAVHLDEGIYLLIGHYMDYDRGSKELTAFPMMRLEINPNKHADKPIFKALMELINRCCYDCSLTRYDYAIDVPVRPEDVQVFGSRKEKGLYKGTRYFGQRNKNGFCRIYDKAKEQKLDTSLTRIEHVVSLTKTTKKVSFESVYIRDESLSFKESLGKTDKVIVELCTLAAANGLDFEPILESLDKRKRRTIKSHLDCGGYKLLEFDNDLHTSLLSMVYDYFEIKEVQNSIKEDKNGFVTLADDFSLPFD